MRTRQAASRTFRWVLLAGCLVVAFALFRLFWTDASGGRTSREVDRIESAQERIVQEAPSTAPAPVPARP